MAYFNANDYRYKQEENKKKNEIEKTLDYVFKKFDEKIRLMTIIFDCDYLPQINNYIKEFWKKLDDDLLDDDKKKLNTNMSYDYFVKRFRENLKEKYKFFETEKYISYGKKLKFWTRRFGTYSDVELKIVEVDKKKKIKFYSEITERLKKRLKNKETEIKNINQTLKDEIEKSQRRIGNDDGRIKYLEKEIELCNRELDDLEKDYIYSEAVNKILENYLDYFYSNFEKINLIKKKINDLYSNGKMTDEEVKEIVNIIHNSFDVIENIGIERFI